MADGDVPNLGPGGCYPSDFVGPLPEGANYCNAPNTPTVFGSINSIITAAGKTAANMVNTLKQFGGKTTPVTVTVQPTSAHTGVAFLIVAAVIGVLVWLIIRERG